MDELAWHDEEPPAREPGWGGPEPTRRALRLTFRFDGESVELTSAEPLRKLIPPMLGEHPEEGRHHGEWIQLRDRDGRVLFSGILSDPLRTRVEVHDPDAGPSIVVGPPGQGTFDVLVPDLPEATTAVLFASIPSRKGKLRPATAIGRFDLPGAHTRPPDAEPGPPDSEIDSPDYGQEAGQ